MDDDKLSTALRSLPRVEARPDFAAAVWRRLDERRAPRRRPRARWPVGFAVAAACLAVLVLGAREWWHHHQRQQTVARLAVLEEEHRALVAELDSLRRQLSRAEPVVYLGGNNELDVVLDLAELQRSGLRPEDVRPAWFREPGDPPSELHQAGSGSGDVRPASFELPRQPTIY